MKEGSELSEGGEGWCGILQGMGSGVEISRQGWMGWWVGRHVGGVVRGRGGAREGSGVVNRGRREIWSWVARPNPAEAVSDIRGG